MVAAKKAPRGRPLQSGADPRRNPNGRPKAVASLVLRAMITQADLTAIWKQAIADARAGDKDARRDILDRLEGKAIARTETGEPGDFDLDEVEEQTLRAALKVVRGRHDA
jgi:hypothetical protein